MQNACKLYVFYRNYRRKKTRRYILLQFGKVLGYLNISLGKEGWQNDQDGEQFQLPFPSQMFMIILMCSPKTEQAYKCHSEERVKNCMCKLSLHLNWAGLNWVSFSDQHPVLMLTFITNSAEIYQIFVDAYHGLGSVLTIIF